MNDAARRPLGYEQGQEIGGRCKLTTRGTDCDNACPLSFALNNDLDRVDDFPTVPVYKGQQSVDEYLAGQTDEDSNRIVALEEMLLLWLANANPAFGPFRELFDDAGLITAELSQR